MCPWLAERYHWFVPVTTLLALQCQLHATLKWNALIVEWKENDGVETDRGATIIYTHSLP